MSCAAVSRRRSGKSPARALASIQAAIARAARVSGAPADRRAGASSASASICELDVVDLFVRHDTLDMCGRHVFGPGAPNDAVLVALPSRRKCPVRRRSRRLAIVQIGETQVLVGRAEPSRSCRGKKPAAQRSSQPDLKGQRHVWKRRRTGGRRFTTNTVRARTALEPSPEGRSRSRAHASPTPAPPGRAGPRCPGPRMRHCRAVRHGNGHGPPRGASNSTSFSSASPRAAALSSAAVQCGSRPR